MPSDFCLGVVFDALWEVVWASALRDQFPGFCRRGRCGRTLFRTGALFSLLLAPWRPPRQNGKSIINQPFFHTGAPFFLSLGRRRGRTAKTSQTNPFFERELCFSSFWGAAAAEGPNHHKPTFFLNESSVFPPSGGPPRPKGQSITNQLFFRTRALFFLPLGGRRGRTAKASQTNLFFERELRFSSLWGPRRPKGQTITNQPFF